VAMWKAEKGETINTTDDITIHPQHTQLCMRVCVCCFSRFSVNQGDVSAFPAVCLSNWTFGCLYGQKVSCARAQVTYTTWSSNPAEACLNKPVKAFEYCLRFRL